MSAPGTDHMQPRLGSNEGDPVDPRSDAPAAKGGPGGPGVVAVAGEALIDFVPAGRNGLFEAAPGGSPANVAVGLARQEVPVRLLARIADDLLGHRLRAHLDGNRVDLSFAVQAAEPTSLAIVAVGPDGVVEYDFRVKGTADWQWRDHELDGALDGDVVALHAGSLALTRRSGAASRPWSGWPTWSRPAPTTWPGCSRAGRPSRSPRPGWPRAPRSWWSRSARQGWWWPRARSGSCVAPAAASPSSTPWAPVTPA